MSTRLQQIARKRRLLVSLVSEQRALLAAEAAGLQRPLVFADVAWRGYRRLKSNPVVGVIVAAALVAVGPGKLLRVGYRGGAFIRGLLRVVSLLRVLR
jgi:predicted Kef-type K+ transport protein